MPTSIKCSLRGAICLPPDQKHELLGRIESIVITTSKLMRRGSLLALLHYTRLLESEPDKVMAWDDTGWRQAMTLGLHAFEIRKLEDPELKVTYEMYAHLFPDDPTILTQPSNITTHAACRLKTAFHNNLWVPLIPRLRRLCKAWLAHTQPTETVSRQELPSGLSLLRAIESGAVTGFPATATSFITTVRQQLGLSGATKLTEFYAKVKARQPLMLRFLSWLQGQLQLYGRRGVKLCPVFSVRRQHVDLDATSILQLLYSMGLIPKPLLKASAFSQNTIRSWVSSTITPPKVCSSHREKWRCFLSTDGVAASFVYGDDQAAARPKPKQHPMPAHDDCIVVGIDPGRCTVVHAATRTSDSCSEWTLSRKRYYLESGVLQAQGKERRWDRGLAAVWSKLQETEGVLKTNSTEAICNYITAYNAMAADWWESAMQRKRGKLRFRTYGGRKRCLDCFYHGMKTDIEAQAPDKKVVIAYGAATFSPSGSGKPATPTTAAFKACTRLRGQGVLVEKQNECRTSKQCCHCHGDVQSCWRWCAVHQRLGPGDEVQLGVEVETRHGMRVPRLGSYLRGLLFCPNCSKFLNRDRSAALNIRHLFIETQLLKQPMPQQFQARRVATTNQAR